MTSTNALLLTIFLAIYSLGSELVNAADTAASRNLHLNGQHFQNSKHKFKSTKQGHVAFMGGSITEMNGYRPIMMEWLKAKFPQTAFTFTNAGISSTCSTTGAFRLRNDVLSKGPVDLFFLEFAVNDDQDAGHAKRECIRGMEGVIRQVRRHNPKAEIVLTNFVNPGMLAKWRDGKVPLSAAAHSAVAKHYRVSVNDLGKELADRISAGTFDWKTYGGVHPKRPGNQLCADLIQSMLERSWIAKGEAKAYKLPELLDSGSYVRGRFLKLADVQRGDGWALSEPDWKNIKGGKRSRFVGVPMLHSTTPGAECKLTFEGQTIGAFIVAGPDAGVIEGSVDGQPFKPVNTYHRFSKGLNYPRTVVLASDLKAGTHQLVLRISQQTTSGGHASRVVQMVAN